MTPERTPETADAPRPRLFVPDDEAPANPTSPAVDTANPWGDSAEIGKMLTLSLLWSQHHKPKLVALGRAADTVEHYDRSVRRWLSYLQAVPIPRSLPHFCNNDGILCPVVAEISSRALLGFQSWLKTSEKLSNRETNKTTGDVIACLTFAKRNGFITSSPEIQHLPEKTAATLYTLDRGEFNRIYKACSVATWPAWSRPTGSLKQALPYDAADGWRALLLLWVTYGMRTQDAVAYKSASSPLLWSDVRDDARNPHPAGKLENESGWLVFTPDKTKSTKSDQLVLPITPAVRLHLDKIRGDAPADSPVFNWPLTSGSIAKDLPGLQWQFSKICEAAKVAPRDVDGDRVAYQPKHLRKTCVTWLEDHRPTSSQFVTGHASDRSPDAAIPLVQRRHYRNAEALVLDALLTLPILD